MCWGGGGELCLEGLTHNGFMQAVLGHCWLGLVKEKEIVNVN